MSINLTVNQNQGETETKSKMITGRKSFSRRQLVVFALVFAAVGGYAINQSFASVPVGGLPHVSGTLIRFSDKKEVFMVDGNKLRPVSYEAYQTHGFSNQEIRAGTEADSKLPAGEPFPLADGAVVSEGDKTYQLETIDGKLKKREIVSTQRLSQLLKSQLEVTQLSGAKLPKDNLEPLKNYGVEDKHPNGTLLLAPNGKTYLLENGKRRLIDSSNIAKTHNLDAFSVTAESSGDRALPLGKPLEPKPGAVVKGPDGTLYIIEKATTRRLAGLWGGEVTIKRPLRSHQAFMSYDYKDSEVVDLSDAELHRLPTGKALPESPSAPVKVVIVPNAGEDTKKLSEEYIRRGAKPRHTYPEWFTMEMPHDLSEDLKKDSRVKSLDGFALTAAVCMESAVIACGGPPPPPPPPELPPDPPPAPPPPPPPAPPPPPDGQPPVVQSDPTIQGLAKVGETLVSNPGSWINGVSGYVYKWQRCTTDQPNGYGSDCVDMSNGSTQNYQLVEADKGLRVRVVITASNQYGSSIAAPSKVTLPVASAPAAEPPPPPPSPSDPAPEINLWKFNTGNTWFYSVNMASRCEVRVASGGIQPFTPSLGGTYSVSAGNGNQAGQLKCWNGSVGPVTSPWSGPADTPPPPPANPGVPAPTINLWQFNTGNSWTYNVSNASYCEVHIAGGGIQPFTPTLGLNSTVTAGDGGKAGQLKCWNGSVGPAVSQSVGPSGAPPPANPIPVPGIAPAVVQNPIISGQPTVGSVLSANPGYWKNGVDSFAYQWYRCGEVDIAGYGVNCTTIVGAKKPQYKIAGSDATTYLTVKVTAKNSYGSNSAASLATALITGGSGVASITSEPQSPVAKGTNVEIEWYMQYGSNCTASAEPTNTNWTGPKPPTGEQVIGAVNLDSTFYLSCNFQSATKTKIALEVKLTTQKPTPPPPSPPSPIAGKCSPGSDWAINRSGLAFEVHKLVNEYRAKRGLQRVNTSATLTDSANWKSMHMAWRKAGTNPGQNPKYWGHDDYAPPFERTFAQRIDDCGYKGQMAGENIAFGYTSPQAVMKAWISSPGHKANLDQPAWRAIGVGVAESTDGTLYWTQNFGSALDGAKTGSAQLPDAPVSRNGATANITQFQANSPHLARVGMTEGGGSSAGSIAVLDTGVEKHPLLNVTEGFNCIPGDNTPATNDANGHGTQVAGVIGAKGDGINTPRGIAPGTQIVPVKVADANGAAAWDSIACGVRWASQRNLTINMSLADGTSSNDCTRIVSADICAAAARTRVVVAAGNKAGGISKSWPANLPGVIAVTSMHDSDGRPGQLTAGITGSNGCPGDDQVADYSNYSDGLFNVIAAPGCVFTTTKGGGSQRTVGGTSMAAPMVSGGGIKTDASPAYMYLPPSNGRSYGPLLRL